MWARKLEVLVKKLLSPGACVPRAGSPRRINLPLMILNNTGEQRKSYMDFGPIYFRTATINGWQRLFHPDNYKDEMIGSLRTLSDRGKIDVFGFVVMPNHLHLIWRMKELNDRGNAAGFATGNYSGAGEMAIKGSA